MAQIITALGFGPGRLASETKPTKQDMTIKTLNLRRYRSNGKENGNYYVGFKV